MTHEQKRERRKQIAELVRRTGDVDAAAGAFGVTIATVLNSCRENGVKPNACKPVSA